jgi:glycerol-3-phosphate O-acyltransferase
VLRPYIDAYSVVAQQLLELPETGPFDEQRFIGQCLLTGQQWALQRRICSEESTSAEMFRTALRLARHRNLVESDVPDVGPRRRDFAEEIRLVQRRIESIAAEAARHESATGV